MTDYFDKVAGGLANDGDSAPLFRSEAILAASSTGLGRPVALFPLSWTVLSGLILLIASAVVLLLGAGSYSRKETVTGSVRTTGGEFKVNAPTAGIITDLPVVEGQHVRAGQVIVKVETARIGVDGQPVDDASVRSLDDEVANLSGRLQALNRGTTIEDEGNRSRLADLARELSAEQAVEFANRQRAELAEQALTRMEPVAKKGFISAEAMRRRRDEIISLRQNMAEARGRQANLTGQVDGLRATRAQRPYLLFQERGQLLDLLARAHRDRDSYTAQRGYAVRAPSDGVVTALQAEVGQMADPQRPLMAISQPGATVTAELYVPSRAIGFLQAGQRVRVRYDAFPYQQFGAAQGRVRSISSSVLRPTEIEAAVDLKEPVYRVVVSLDSDTVAAYGRKHRVQPGMALSADVVLDDRSFASWLLDPLMSLRGRL